MTLDANTNSSPHERVRRVSDTELHFGSEGRHWFGTLRARVAVNLARFSVPFLRTALAIVYVWFGVLKVAGLTPVADLVAASVPWFDRSWFVPSLGMVEIVLGFGLFIPRFRAMAALIIVAHLAGTFLVLIMEPDLSFQYGNVLMLTTIGEFVVKNLVLGAAALVVATSALGDSRENRSGPRHHDVPQ